MKPIFEKIGLFLLGAISAGSFAAYDSIKERERVLEALAQSIAQGDFCPADAEEAEEITDEAEEIFFVGCGGFF